MGGAPRDLGKALYWLKRAIDCGYPLLQHKKDKLDRLANSPEVQFQLALQSLESLIGLGGVKTEINKLAKFNQVQKIRASSGLKTPQGLSRHLVFTGNPGTGKTTVARILANIYFTLGMIKTNKLTEIDRSALVGQYVGQTAIKTLEAANNALDGVLFIDEAYSLSVESENDFGGEAIDTLLKFIEDNRDRLIVIVAGYRDEMTNFIHMNPGLASRFNTYIDFPDYTALEMQEIFLKMCQENDYKIEDQANIAIQDELTLVSSTKGTRFSNGRFIRNVFEKAIEFHALRISFLMADDDPASMAMLQTLLAADIRDAFAAVSY